MRCSKDAQISRAVLALVSPWKLAGLALSRVSNYFWFVDVHLSTQLQLVNWT